MPPAAAMKSWRRATKRRLTSVPVPARRSWSSAAEPGQQPAAGCERGAHRPGADDGCERRGAEQPRVRSRLRREGRCHPKRWDPGGAAAPANQTAARSASAPAARAQRGPSANDVSANTPPTLSPQSAPASDPAPPIRLAAANAVRTAPSAGDDSCSRSPGGGTGPTCRLPTARCKTSFRPHSVPSRRSSGAPISATRGLLPTMVGPFGSRAAHSAELKSADGQCVIQRMTKSCSRSRERRSEPGSRKRQAQGARECCTPSASKPQRIVGRWQCGSLPAPVSASNAAAQQRRLSGPRTLRRASMVFRRSAPRPTIRHSAVSRDGPRKNTRALINARAPPNENHVDLYRYPIHRGRSTAPQGVRHI